MAAMSRPGRPVPTLATACAALASALSQPRPPWCSEATWSAARALVAAARVDLLAATGGKVPSKTEAAEALRARLGAGRATVADWLRGWLAP